MITLFTVHRTTSVTWILVQHNDIHVSVTSAEYPIPLTVCSEPLESTPPHRISTWFKQYLFEPKGPPVNAEMAVNVLQFWHLSQETVAESFRQTSLDKWYFRVHVIRSTESLIWHRKSLHHILPPMSGKKTVNSINLWYRIFSRTILIKLLLESLES